MKLLVVTQAVDANDPILGFFHRWLEKLAGRFSEVIVICLREGEHALPGNVRVFSLGKKINHQSSTINRRCKYAFKFLNLIRELRYGYDAVFVHMNPEYVILGGLFWRAWGKRIALWYNHPHEGLRLHIAAWMSHTVFYTSPHAAPARFEKAKRMPAGIDTDLFAPQSIPHDRERIHLQGRIVPSKRIETALAALRILRERMPNASLIVVGPEADAAYAAALRADFSDLVAERAALFLGARRNEDTPALYGAAGVALNLAAAGHFDKTVLEAMACETPPVVASAGWEDLLPPECIVPENDPAALAAALARLIALPDGDYRALGKRMRDAVMCHHGLAALTDGITARLSSTVAARPMRAFVWRILYAFSRTIPHGPRMTVLVYHSVSRANDVFAVSPEEFERQMRYLKEKFDIVPLARAFEHANGKKIARDSVALTFDDGYRDFVTEVVPVLKRYGIPATVFVMGGEPDRAELGNGAPLLSDADAAALRDPLITMGSHGMTHRKLTRLPVEDLRAELAGSRTAIERMFGTKPDYLAYPKGSLNAAVEQAAKEAGYAGAASVRERGVLQGDDAFALPRIQIDAATPLPLFKAKLSKAADWYYALWRLFRR